MKKYTRMAIFVENKQYCFMFNNWGGQLWKDGNRLGQRKTADIWATREYEINRRFHSEDFLTKEEIDKLADS